MAETNTVVLEGPMQQLSGLDASFLAVESGSLLGHVTGVLLLDPSTTSVPLTIERLRAHIDARTVGVAPLRRRVVEVPFGLDRPWWIDVDELDLDYHIKSVVVPAPGGRDELADLAGQFHSVPLDRSRPLWELWLAEGLADGCLAMITKVHHAAIDGLSGVEILGALVDLDAEGLIPALPNRREAPTDRRTEPPSAAWLLSRAGLNLARSPIRAVDMARQVARSLPALRPLLGSRGPAATGQESLIDLIRQPAFTPPSVAFNDVIGPHRSFTYASIDLGEVKRIKAAAGVTVNDVTLAVAAGALRLWLVDHGGIPDRPLTAAIPVSTRSPDHDGALGNHISIMVTTLATHIDDPAARLAAIAEGTKLAKTQHGALPASILTDITQVAPPAVLGAATRLISSLRLGAAAPLVNVVVSNVPGPPVDLYLAGTLIRHHYPLSAIIDGAGLNITVMSVGDHLDVGIVSDGVLVADQWSLADAVPVALAELTAVTRPAKKRAATRSGAKKAAPGATKRSRP